MAHELSQKATPNTPLNADMRVIGVCVLLAVAADASSLTKLALRSEAEAVLKLRGGKKAPPPPPTPLIQIPGLPEGFPGEVGSAATVGGILGFCVGKAAKSAAQGVAVALGACAAAGALLSNMGYVTVHVSERTEPRFVRRPS